MTGYPAKEEAGFLIKHDYLNDYSAMSDIFLCDTKAIQRIRQALSKKGNWRIRGFSECYNPKWYTSTDLDDEQIEKLDSLSQDANHFLSESDVDLTAFLNVAAKAAETCDRTEIAEIFRSRIKT